MTQPPHQLQIPTAINQRRQRPHIRHSPRVPRDDEFARHPLVPRAFVKGAAEEALVLTLAHLLPRQEVSVQRVQQQMRVFAEEDVAAGIADARCADGGLAGGVQHADAVVPIEAPEEDVAVCRGGEEGAEHAAGGQDCDWRAVPEEVLFRLEVDVVARGVDVPNADCAVCSARYEDFAVDERRCGDGADVRVFVEAEEAAGMCGEEADAVVCEADFHVSFAVWQQVDFVRAGM